MSSQQCSLFDEQTSDETVSKRLILDTTKAFPTITDAVNKTALYVRLHDVVIDEIDEKDDTGKRRLRFCAPSANGIFDRIDAAVKAQLRDKVIQNQLVDDHVLSTAFIPSASSSGLFNAKLPPTDNTSLKTLTIKREIATLYITPAVYVLSDLRVGVAYQVRAILFKNNEKVVVI